MRKHSAKHIQRNDTLAGMLKFGVFALLIFLGSCSTDNRQVTADMINFPPSADAEADPNAPVISFDSTECRFGSIVIGAKVVHSFKFTNTGKSPLIISQVTPSCGCTTPKDWPKNPIAPGEGGQITVEFNSTGFPGKIDKSISVLTNCLPKTWDLKLSGEVLGVESVTPKTKPFEMERTN